MSGVCPTETARPGPSLFQNGNLVFQAHHVGWIVSALFTMAATITSFWLIGKHLQWYTNKREQRYIVRILFMVPIYAIISLASYLFWNHSTPLLLIRDAYESTVLTSFFYLLLLYLSPEPDEQRLIFRTHGLSTEADKEAERLGEPIKRWMFPLGFIKWKPSDGLYFLQLMKWGVLQYCVIRPTTTLAAVILQNMGLYCEESWAPTWGHIYITVIISISVTIAMYCLIQMYMAVSVLLQPKKPLLKLFAIKAVVFLTFWQATFLSLLSMFGVVKDTTYMTAEDINIGIGALLETFEMMIFGFLHVKAFSYKPYKPVAMPGEKDIFILRTPRLKSLGHALDFRETFREIWHGAVYLRDKAQGKLPQSDMGARQFIHYEEAFGRSRLGAADTSQHERNGKPSGDWTFDNNGEIQWSGGVEGYYGVGIRRERSEGLAEQIDKELERRGYGSEPATEGHAKQRSWWRSIYERFSQSDPDPVSIEPPSSAPRHSKHCSKTQPVSADYRHPEVLEGLLSTNDRPGHRSSSGALGPVLNQPPTQSYQPTGESSRTPRHSRRRDKRRESHRRLLDDPDRDKRPKPRSSSSKKERFSSPVHSGDSVLDRVFTYRADVDVASEERHTVESMPLQFGMAGRRSVFQAQVTQAHEHLGRDNSFMSESNPSSKSLLNDRRLDYRSSGSHRREAAASSPTSPTRRPHMHKVKPVIPQPLSTPGGG